MLFIVDVPAATQSTRIWRNNMAAKSTANHYGSIAVAIHWASALLIIGLLATGIRMDNTVDLADKAEFLKINAPMGISVLALTLLRIVWWLHVDKKPVSVSGMPGWQKRASSATHLTLYVVILAMTASGIGMMILSGAREILFSGAPGPLPDFWNYPPRLPHAIGAKIMVFLVVLHAGAALYHQFFLKDGLLRRMWWQ